MPYVYNDSFDESHYVGDYESSKAICDWQVTSGLLSHDHGQRTLESISRCRDYNHTANPEHNNPLAHPGTYNESSGLFMRQGESFASAKKRVQEANKKHRIAYGKVVRRTNRIIATDFHLDSLEMLAALEGHPHEEELAKLLMEPLGKSDDREVLVPNPSALHEAQAKEARHSKWCEPTNPISQMPEILANLQLYNVGYLGHWRVEGSVKQGNKRVFISKRLWDIRMRKLQYRGIEDIVLDDHGRVKGVRQGRRETIKEVKEKAKTDKSPMLQRKLQRLSGKTRSKRK